MSQTNIRRRSKGNPGLTRVLFTIAVILLIAALLGGALGASMQESL